MVISLFVMVVGALLFVPAANMVSFPLTLSAIFVLASGVCALADLGQPLCLDSRPRAQRIGAAQPGAGLQLLGLGCWRPGLRPASSSPTPARSPTRGQRRTCSQGPYVAIAAALLVLGFAVMFMHLPAITHDARLPPRQRRRPAAGRSIWSYSHTVLGMVGIFFYVGVEIALAAISIQYCQAAGNRAMWRRLDSWLRSTTSALWRAASWAAR